ncbi:hypothetical protein K458DRAFT_405352 [Lentithecium fluviatile CBS 122367]|uniref:Uncharacterized protein n=1 Tax=Lentithecium fluviatile CBS 122367 TaxID=1168545 RepID=A0A6G1IXA6_9PLEO|nr:hypothetical protein K458DRAFT_405352 [Lentithecium fluviatile CBS 122367]
MLTLAPSTAKLARETQAAIPNKPLDEGQRHSTTATQDKADEIQDQIDELQDKVNKGQDEIAKPNDKPARGQPQGAAATFAEKDDRIQDPERQRVQTEFEIDNERQQYEGKVELQGQNARDSQLQMELSRVEENVRLKKENAKLKADAEKFQKRWDEMGRILREGIARRGVPFVDGVPQFMGTRCGLFPLCSL